MSHTQILLPHVHLVARWNNQSRNYLAESMRWSQGSASCFICEIQDRSTCTLKEFHFPWCGLFGGSEQRGTETTGSYVAVAIERRMAQLSVLKAPLEACHSGVSSTAESLVGM